MIRGVVLLLTALLAIVLAAPAAAASREHLTAAERAQINATLDTFVNHAVKRKDVGAAYDTVTPNLRGDQTRKEFAKGNIGVFPYPAAGTKHHGWTVEALHGNNLVIQLFLFPQKGSGAGSAAVQIAMKRLHGRWLVDNMTPGAFFAPTGKQSRVVGTYDFGPGNPSGGGSGSGSGVHGVSANWAFAPFAIFGAILAIILAGILVAMFRHRRYVATQGGSLPPLHVRAGEDSQSRG